ncbi:hypothetical protein ACOQFV_27470 [Nocardiopsis changdeensis]|uniref:Uncharacterized protein n=1 Tax=Nocardiopsis changdeensis TaxID=2831969 RepID=A0ABX8BQK9_9ACTN|nr:MULTISPECIES: hypothetical protein [Nocardiopsis]QUX23008.1 hypothetical protein KGD84_00930 [Nocardiopsis changdeensis]QYX38951.1 hypothetical protein K1J57_10380 [Nocardiopsis sp. MT53]
MPILDIQQRIRELGRIRIGQVLPTKNGRTRPAKLDRFRLTSASRPLLEKVAELYGGQVQPWTPANGGPSQWEVFTTADRLPVYIPPQPVTQWYELWSGGGCQRRCDGRTEVLRDIMCPCGPDPEARECKPTTRLNVVLRDVPGVGVWRLESHGYYAAVELPGVANMLAQTGGYVSAWLALEERTAKRDGQTRTWMVPTLEVDATPTALMAGEGGIAPAVSAGKGPAEIEAPPQRDWIAEASEAPDFDALRALWAQAQAAGAPDSVAAAMKARAAELRQRAEPEPAAPAPAPVAPPAAPEPDADAMWMACVAAAPDDWSTTELMEAYSAQHEGALVDDATGAQLAAFADALRAGRVPRPGVPGESVAQVVEDHTPAPAGDRPPF